MRDWGLWVKMGELREDRAWVMLALMEEASSVMK